MYKHPVRYFEIGSSLFFQSCVPSNPRQARRYQVDRHDRIGQSREYQYQHSGDEGQQGLRYIIIMCASLHRFVAGQAAVR